jgi:hypothetical protein
MNPVRLSEKAYNFAESRRGSMLLDDYVSRLIENVSDLSGEGIIMPEGMRIIEVIEAFRPGYTSVDSGYRTIADEVIDYLREAYHDKVPRAVFRRKCSERGLSDEEIDLAEQIHGQWLSI